MSEPALGSEKEALVSSLENQRHHVLGILEGLSDEDLRRPVLPSGWTCVGLVQHLSFDVERLWFRRVVAGEPNGPGENAASAWEVAPEVPAGAVLESYREQIGLANTIIAATALEAAPAWWPDFFGTWRLQDLREVILHVITETACHAGHLDAARELIDGRRWLVLNN
jgi:hypothetical protein